MGTYWDELACMCFNVGGCEEVVCEEGLEVMPTLGSCECSDKETVDGLYPKWATDEHKALAREAGLERYATRLE